MTSLVRPDVARRLTWAAAMRELRDEGGHVNGSGLWLLPAEHRWDLSPAGCRRLVDVLLAAVETPARGDQPDDGSPRPVPCHFLWILDDQTAGAPVVGFLALRTVLTRWLLAEGGNIGYSVMPSVRRRGHANRALELAVDYAGTLGLAHVLVTCDEANLASARTIESGGGVLEDVRNGKRRYWITPGGDGSAGG